MNPEEIGSYLEEYDYDYFLNAALEKVPEGIDIREGSIIFDALAPACYQLADFIMQLKTVLLDTFTQTAVGEYLDLRAEEHGIKRIKATKAIVLAKFTGSEGEPYKLLETGDRFSAIGDNPTYYTVLAPAEQDGQYTLQAETAGVIGNEYIGSLLPIDNFNGLESATLLEVIIPARDDESDDSLRERILRTRLVVSFGGNIEDYINLTTSIEGVGGVQVYPVWNGGGTVKLSILNNLNGIASGSLIQTVQDTIDPEPGRQLGYGLAPIGHKVTVVTPVQLLVNIKVHVDPATGTTLEALKPKIEASLSDYFLSLRQSWGTHDDMYQYQQTVFRSQIIATIISVEGVANVTDLLLNNQDGDIHLTLSGERQELAFLGEVSYL